MSQVGFRQPLPVANTITDTSLSVVRWPPTELTLVRDGVVPGTTVPPDRSLHRKGQCISAAIHLARFSQVRFISNGALIHPYIVHRVTFKQLYAVSVGYVNNAGRLRDSIPPSNIATLSGHTGATHR